MNEWKDFFLTIAPVSAALLAIAFLAFQIKSDIWHGRTRRWVAYLTLMEFGAPLLSALFFLMPSHPWRVSGLLVGPLGVFLVVAYWCALWRRRQKRREISRFDKTQAWLSIVSFVIFGALAVIPWYVVQHTALNWQGGLLVWLLLSGSYESWSFLSPDDPASADGPGVEA